MIKDTSQLSKVGLALLRKNREKLVPIKSIQLKILSDQQVIVITGSQESFESNSFGWGRADERTKALSEAIATLGWSLPVEMFQKLAYNEGCLINKD